MRFWNVFQGEINKKFWHFQGKGVTLCPKYDLYI